jgi:hypothetical protein
MGPFRAVMVPSRAAVLIIRVWFEEGSAQPLRAHIRLTGDVTGGFDSDMTVTQVDVVCQTVRAWLTDLLTTQHQP